VRQPRSSAFTQASAKMGKRTKQYKKLMRSFEFLGFRQPYQLLMTSDVLLDTLKLDLIPLLEKTLSTKNLKPMITQCCIVCLPVQSLTLDMIANLRRSGHSTTRTRAPIGILLLLLRLRGQRRSRGGDVAISWTRVPRVSESACCRL